LIGKKGRGKREGKNKKKSHRRFSLSSPLALSHLDLRAPLFFLTVFEGKRFFPSTARALFLQQTNRGKRGRTLSSSLFLSNFAKQTCPGFGSCV